MQRLVPTFLILSLALAIGCGETAPSTANTPEKPNSVVKTPKPMPAPRPAPN